MRLSQDNLFDSRQTLDILFREEEEVKRQKRHTMGCKVVGDTREGADTKLGVLSEQSGRSQYTIL